MSRGIRFPWLLVLPGLLGLAVGCAAPEVADSPDARMERALQLTRLAVASGALDRTLDQGAELGAEYSVDELRLELRRELTEEEKGKVYQVIRGVLAEFLTADAWEEALAGVYVEHFTAQELEEVLRFFESPAGAKVLGLEARLEDEVAEAEEAILGGRLEEFVARVDEGLAAELGLDPEAGR